MEDDIKRIISAMTLDEKIGQMIVLEINDSNEQDITNHHIGALFIRGGGGLESKNPEDWANKLNNLQRTGLNTRFRIPLLIGTDAVHGHGNFPSSTIFPHNIGLSCTRSPSLIYKIADMTAKEIYALGFNWVFAPCIPVVQDIRWGRTYESLDQSLITACINGFQGNKFSNRGDVLATAKHFIGDGATTYGTGTEEKRLLDRGDCRLDEKTIREILLPGYIDAINAGTLCIMASYNSINGLKMHANKYWLTDVLKTELGFKGFVVGDWDAVRMNSFRNIWECGDDYRENIKKAVNAGIDMAMEPFFWRDYLANLKDLVLSGEVTEDRINDAVYRILRTKFTMNLFRHPFAGKEYIPTIGCKEHRETAREAVRKSVTLIKGAPVGLSNKKITIIGEHADNHGLQCGGWTTKWQGIVGDVPGATSILEGFKEHCEVRLVTEDSPVEESDVLITVTGEQPYAEFYGDCTEEELKLSNKYDETSKKYKEKGAVTILVIISGRPLIISKEQKEIYDVIFSAWLPGSEGAGIADALFDNESFQESILEWSLEESTKSV